MHEQLAREAIELVMPAIIQLIATGRAKREHLHIIVLDPRATPADYESPQILCERSVGKQGEWAHDYRKIAVAKATQAWRDGRANINTQMLGPATLRKGDTVYYGSFEYQGVIVACSGIQPWFDMLVSGWIAIAFQQLAQDHIQKIKEKNPDLDFLDI